MNKVFGGDFLSEDNKERRIEEELAYSIEVLRINVETFGKENLKKYYGKPYSMLCKKIGELLEAYFKQPFSEADVIEKVSGTDIAETKKRYLDNISACISSDETRRAYVRAVWNAEVVNPMGVLKMLRASVVEKVIQKTNTNF